MRVIPCLITILLIGTANQARAADYCVDDGVEFREALNIAAASSEADTIRIATDLISFLGPIDVVIKGDLRIFGNYTAGCTLPNLGPAPTTVDGLAGTLFRLNLSGDDLTLTRLRFQDFSSVTLADTTHISTIVTGQILVQRCAFVAQNSGLLVQSNYHDVRIENSLFDGSTNDGGTIYNGAGFAFEKPNLGSTPIQVELINNTAVGNKNGYVLSAFVTNDFVPVLTNNVAFDNRLYDLVLRLPAVVGHSLWVTQDLSSGGALAAGSGNNLSIDPQLNASLKPIEPGSPLINSGNNTPIGGLPASDYDGGKRLIGTRVDRGAYESSVNDATNLTVTNTNNSGAGSLRQAITDANSTAGQKTIEFNITGACPRIITVSSALPALLVPTAILGYTQPGSVPNSDAQAFNGTLCIALSGGGTVANGLHFQTSADQTMSVEGFAFYGFTSEAVLVSGEGVGNVRGNAFGTGAAAIFTVAGFADAAIRVQNAPGSVIGGYDVVERNVITRAEQVGVRLEASTGQRIVRNNLIGFGVAGTSAIANGIGISVGGSYADDINRNRIGFNSSHGIRVEALATPAQKLRVLSNILGVSVNGNPAGNGANGLRVSAGSEHIVSGNTIRHNGTDGLVVLEAARRVQIVSNSISDNVLQAIDLSPDGVNLINLDVGAVGANDNQNFPALFGAEGTDTDGVVSGNLSSANGTYLIQLFQTAGCDADLFGEAGMLIGSAEIVIANATVGVNGSAEFLTSVTSSGGLIGDVITAIATDEEGNSSEVSVCMTYVQGTIFEDGFE